MFISSKTFTLAYFPGKKYLPFPILLPLACVGGRASPGGGHWEKAVQKDPPLPESQAKWNCSELAGSYFLRVMSGRR